MATNKLEEVIVYFPHGLSWVGSYSGLDKLGPDTEKAVIQGADVRRDGVRLTVVEGGREFSCVLAVPNGALRKAVREVLSEAHGTRLAEAGELTISVGE
jgi:hypothetical protein